MGLLNTFGRLLGLAAAMPPPVAPYVDSVALVRRPPLSETGFTGTTNYGGMLQVEQASRLQHEQAFGRAGNLEWGEYERIALTDPAVVMALDFITAPILDARVDVEAAIGRDATEQTAYDAHAAFLKWALTEQLEPGFSDVLDQMTRGALGSGFSLHELVWEQAAHESLPGGRGFVVRRLGERLPSSLPINCWLEDDAGLLSAIRQQGPNAGKWLDIELPIEKLQLCSWARRGNNYQGRSAFRSVDYLCQVREQLIKLVAVSLVREGAGIPVAYTDDKETPLPPAAALELDKMMRNLVFHENAHVRMPPGWKFEWVFSGAANKGHVVDAYNSLGLIILAVLQAQQMMLGVNETGSRSVGEVHASAAVSYVQKVVAFLESNLNGVGNRPGTGLVRKQVDVNFGPQTAYPKLKLTLKKQQLAVEKKAAIVVQAKAGGLLTWRHQDENALREDIGFAPVTEEEFTAEAERKASVAAAISGQPAADDQKPKPGENPFAKKAAGVLRHGAQFQPSRPLRASEKHLDLTRMANFLDAGREAFEREAKPLLTAALTKAAAGVTAAMADGDPSDVAQVPLDLAAFDAFVARYLADAAREGAGQVRAELKRAGDRTSPAALSHATGDEPDDPDAAIQAELDAQRKMLVRKVGQRLSQQLEDTAIDVQRTGGDASDVISRVVVRQLESGALKNDAGSVLTRAWNGGREMAAEQMGGVDFVELSAVLDSSTCMPCSALDGAQFDFQSAEHDAHVPPLAQCDGGAACRCVLLYRKGQPGEDT